MSKLYKTTWFLLNTCFPSGSLECWNVPVRGCQRDQPSLKTLGAKYLMSTPDIHDVLSQLNARGISMSYVTSHTSPHLTFPFAGCAVCPFPVMNYGMSTTIC